jgi:protein-tyrosine phosphatase
MIKGTRNQLANVNNYYQGKTKRVLTVCSAGLLRSATLANFLVKEYGYNVRNCGTEDYALIPISEALVKWADEIIFVNEYNFNRVKIELEELEVINKVRVLDMPDDFGFNDPGLIEICRKQYKE